MNTTTGNNSKIQNLLSSNSSQYYPQKSNTSSTKTGDISTHRPIIQANIPVPSSSSSSSAFKITQVGPVNGSNVIVSRMDTNNVIVQRPNSASPIPTSGPLSSNPSYYYKPQVPRVNPPSTASSGPGSTNFYHNTANNVTKFTNMTVNNTGSKNPLKPTHHYAVPTTSSTGSNTNSISGGTSNNTSSSNIVNLSTHPNSNLSAPNTSGMAPKTTLKASDLIHILPNLFNTLKRRNSNSGIINGSNANGMGSITGGKNNNSYFNNNGKATNSLAAAVAAAASNSGKPLTTSTAAALVAEQLLNVAASGPFSDDSSSSPPPQNQNSQQYNLNKRLKISDPNALQCDICGKVYKHRNCLSKHMWEHHESWEHTKKVCQTKHQQVQLLEAAQVLTEIISGVVRKDRGYTAGTGTGTTGTGNVSNSNNPNNNNYNYNNNSDYDETDEYENEEDDDEEEEEMSTAKKLKEMEIIESWGNEEDNISIG